MQRNQSLRILIRGSLVMFVFASSCVLGSADDSERAGQLQFERDVQPILAEYCFGCHADGESEGSMSFDTLLKNEDRIAANQDWYRVLKQLQAGLMPPADEEQPTNEQVATVLNWIKFSAFGLRPDAPDPGRVTVRRLNQVEYRNTIRDLLGVEYDTAANFPADDTGHGFDNIGDVLSVSPLLLEKYVNAAKEIVSSAVPTTSGVIREEAFAGEQFKTDPKPDSEDEVEVEEEPEQPARRGFGRGRFRQGQRSRPMAPPGTLELSYYEEATARAILEIEQTGDYLLRLNLKAVESYVDNQFDLNKCDFTFAFDGDVLLHREFVRQGGKDFAFDFARSLSVGPHEVVVTVSPLSKEQQIRSLRLQIKSIDIVGPKDEQFFVKPNGYERFFPRDVPESAADRREYAVELIRPYVTRAFRRPVDAATIDRLVDLAESVYADGGDTFEAGIAKAMTAAIASPRFLFREEALADDGSTDDFPLLDEYSLASRLSYFLWSTMPDEELIALASNNQLRANLDQQVARMLNDDKSQAFAENFVGQWLKARAIDSIQINARAIIQRETKPDPDADAKRQRFFELFRKQDDRTEEEKKEFLEAQAEFRRRFRGPRFDLTSDLRRAMRRETEMLFEHIIKNDRSILEMVDSDYTFLNSDLAEHYQIDGIENVEGDEMRLVALPANSIRGGVLTQGTVLAVTSNPDRTSPVKRGLFILENLLGMPPPAPPPNIPALEDVASDSEEKRSLRKTLAIHRENVLCSSCHNRMDPLGLALENFNALGRFREAELGQPIDAAGVLATGESFTLVSELKKILVEDRQTDLYRCTTEKMLTYALGRAIEFSDVQTVDAIVDDLEGNDGRASSLVYGIVHSAAFQRTQNPAKPNLAARFTTTNPD